MVNMTMNSIAQHNHFYLDEDPHRPPKEMFKFLVRLAEWQLTPGSTVLDVGCACGAFLSYLRSLYPALSLTGMDISPEFIGKATEALPDAYFRVGDICAQEQLPAKRFDFVFMSGVHYLFSDYELWLRNLLSLTKRSAYVSGLFNREELDVYSVVQRSGDKTSSTPWNLISEKSISVFLDRLNVRHEFFRWELPTQLPRVHADPVRSWTIETKDSGFLVVNGTQMVHRFGVLRVDL
jgi:SAM-dependent methyltransferase